MRVANYLRPICFLAPFLSITKRDPSLIISHAQSGQFSSSRESKILTFTVSLPIFLIEWKARVDPKVLSKARKLAERAADTWTVQRTGFLSPIEIRAVLQELRQLSEIDTLSFGGYPHAERQRIIIMREELIDSHQSELVHISEIIPVKIEGNFLMVKCEASDFLTAMTELGLKTRDLGDLIVVKDTGSFVFTTIESASIIEDKLHTVRSISVQARKVPNDELPALSSRIKELSSVESSLRLDAIASAAFGVSRDKVVDSVKSGNVQINWEVVKKPNEFVEQGDTISLKGKGRAFLEKVELTKKQKYSIKLTRYY